MPVSRIKIFCFSLGFYLIALSYAELEQCKPKQVEVDLEEHIIIHYNLCADPNSVCFHRNKTYACEPDEPSETITTAEIVGENGDSRTLKVQDHKEFHVLLPEEGERFTDTGSFHYNISYKYEAECIPSWFEDCSGWVRDLRLSVTVVDYNLKLLPSSDMDNNIILVTSTTDELQIHSEKNVSLVCSSGLRDKFSSLNIPVTFMFHSKHGSHHRNVSAPCDRNQDTVSVNNGDVKWIITREQSPPYDCVLTIVDFGEHNSGKYRCAGVLSQSDSVSPILHLKLQTKLQTALSISQDLGSWATIFFGILVTFIAAIFLSLLAIVSYSAYRCYKRWRHSFFQNLPRFNEYGSTSTICQDNDLSRPHTPNNNAEDHPFLQYTSGDDTDTHVSEMESSIDTPRNLRFVNRHRRSNVVVESSDISSEDSHHPTGHGYTDGELTDIARAGNAETPPCRHRGDCNNMSLICQYCGKAYCTIYQSQFFTRHEKKCQQAINSGSDSEPGPLRANLAAVEFHLEPGSPSEVHSDTQSPTEAAGAVDGVDQGDLNFISESNWSNPPTSK